MGISLMLMALNSLITFILTSAALSIAPGPDNIFVMSQSALHGRRAGIAIVLGLCSGLVAHTAAVAFGVAAIIQNSAMASSILKWIGAVYLIYLAWQVFTAPVSHMTAGYNKAPTFFMLYRRGIIMNLTNPKVTIFFLAFLPQFAEPEQNRMALQIAILGGLFIAVAFVVFTMIAILAGELGSWLRSSPRAQIGLNRIAGTTLALLALKLATAEAN